MTRDRIIIAGEWPGLRSAAGGGHELENRKADVGVPPPVPIIPAS